MLFPSPSWLLPLLLANATPEASAQPLSDSGTTRTLRTEHFELADVGHAGEALGIAVWRLRSAAGALVLEREVLFRGGPRVLHVESAAGEAPPRLVWREVAEQGGRTLLAQWDVAEGVLELTHWGPDRRVHAERRLVAGAVGPLAAIERLREIGAAAGTSELVLDPLSMALERRGVVEMPAALLPREVRDAGGAGASVLEWRRADGSLAGRFVLSGSGLAAYQWQEGSLWARRIDPERYHDLERRMGAPSAARSAPEIQPAKGLTLSDL